VNRLKDNTIVEPQTILSSEMDAAINGERPKIIHQHITQARYKAVMCALSIACNLEIAKPTSLS